MGSTIGIIVLVFIIVLFGLVVQKFPLIALGVFFVAFFWYAKKEGYTFGGNRKPPDDPPDALTGI